MKRYAVAVFLMALLLGSLAAQAASATFTTRQGEIFQLLLNGHLVNGRGTSQVILDRLPAGKHTIEFRVPARRGFLTYCTNIFLDRGFENNYVLIPPSRNPNFLLKEVGKRPLIAPVACSTCPPQRPHGHAVYDDYDGYGNNHGGAYQNGPNHGGNYNPNYNQGNYNAPGYGNNYNTQPQSMMNSYDVNTLVESIRRKSFDNAKADIAKQALTSQLILAEDAKKVMEQFSFESNRLDFAKFVYDKVYDQQNFYRVYDAFEFDSSITEMQRWLKR
ncbi:DUF4476 domain-containing protein [Adhaeribacter terreus]|uniref:DUF4476 domain-containing protein n=1 Tax=Adhaeribacter terreus TaxID=529703 RepID=A0ABW0EEX8_9BACT